MKFYTWLTSKKNRERDDPVGDLARDAYGDDYSPRGGMYDDWEYYLSNTDAEKAFKQAWKEYEKK